MEKMRDIWTNKGLLSSHYRVSLSAVDHRLSLPGAGALSAHQAKMAVSGRITAPEFTEQREKIAAEDRCQSPLGARAPPVIVEIL